MARLKTAIAKAEEMNLLGDHILGTDFSFHLNVNRGAGPLSAARAPPLPPPLRATGVCPG